MMQEVRQTGQGVWIRKSTEGKWEVALQVRP